MNRIEKTKPIYRGFILDRKPSSRNFGKEVLIDLNEKPVKGHHEARKSEHLTAV